MAPQDPRQGDAQGLLLVGPVKGLAEVEVGRAEAPDAPGRLEFLHKAAEVLGGPNQDPVHGAQYTSTAP